MPVTKSLVCQCGAQKTSHHGVLACLKHCDRPCTRANCPNCRKANVKA